MQIIDRPGWHANLIQGVQPISTRTCLHCGAQDVLQLIPVLDPLTVKVETRILNNLRLTNRFAVRRELSVIADSHSEVAICRQFAVYCEAIGPPEIVEDSRF